MSLSIPLPGMFATVRNRLGVIASVHPWDSRDGSGRTHLVHVEYKDDQFPPVERLVWELEPHAKCQHPTRLPDMSQGAMLPEDFDAMLRSARWTATMPYLDPDGEGPLDRLPICSPLMGAVKVEDFQLVPLYKAMEMPRVALLLADDVGLGKTIEAGLILAELISRRRISRILVLTPAALKLQWRDEMEEKFSLSFEIVDRDSTQRLRKDVGIDANPWRYHDRIITSYHYLKQPDVLEQFLSASRVPDGSPQLPWDMIVVDECHNVMPSTFGDDSDLCSAIRRLLPLCEHRLFLSATPHNGRTRSFTGLLEMLDPVRFSCSSELSDSAKERIKQVMVRRLKRHIDASSPVRRFCKRLPPAEVRLSMGSGEQMLFSAFEEFRRKVHSIVASGEKTRRLSGSFAVEILGKRLISCSTAFADSWWRCREAFGGQETATDTEVEKAGKAAQEDTGSDAETSAREAVASKVVGAWLRNLGSDIEPEIESIDRALVAVGMSSRDSHCYTEVNPTEDSRFTAVRKLIDQLLLDGTAWKDDERIIIFTEFKTSLDYLLRRLREHYKTDDRFLSLYGGMTDEERKVVKNAFNDSVAAVRVLVATDAASEGLNLQQTARYMLHFDCPWNPMRIEQRIGRLDRHGQGRDVQVFHFTSDQSADLRFLSKVIQKIDQVREDLGSCGELIDTGVRRRLVHGEDEEKVSRELAATVDISRKLCHVEADDSSTNAISDPLSPLTAALDLSSETLRETLDSAMAWGGTGRPQLKPSQRTGAAPGAWTLVRHDLPGWKDTVDSSLRVQSGASHLGALRDIAFGSDSFLHPVGDLKVFKNRPDTVLVHLGHPMVRHGLHKLVRTRFPNQESASRWTVRQSELPNGVEALILLSIEELGINKLRETFHHWVRTVAFPVKNGRITEPLAEIPAVKWSEGTSNAKSDDEELASELVADNQKALEAWVGSHKTSIQSALKQQLDTDQDAARSDADSRFRSRAGELSELIQQNSIQRLEREIQNLRGERAQMSLFAGEDERIDKVLREKEQEVARRNRNLEEIRSALEKERDRILNLVIPNRYDLGSDVAVFPVSVEVRFPAGGAR